MPRTIADLSSQELLVVDYLFDMTGVFDFNEYLEERCKARMRAVMEAYMENPVEDLGVLDEIMEQGDKTIEEYYPDPDKIKRPDIAFKAFAGLKRLILVAGQQAAEPGMRARLRIDRDTIPRDRYLRQAVARTALRELIRMVLLDELGGKATRYASGFVEDDEGEPVHIGREVIWDVVHDWLYGDGIVGITEQMIDVRIRGELTVLIALIDPHSDAGAD